MNNKICLLFLIKRILKVRENVRKLLGNNCSTGLDIRLRHGGDVVAGAAHLGEDLVKPLEGTVQVNLNPAWSGGHVLSVVLRPPTLHKGHSDGAHLGQFVDGLKAMVNRLSEKGGELLIVENFQAAARGNLADSSGVEAVVIVAVPGLDEYGGVTETLSVHLSPHVVQVDPLAYMSPGVLDGGVSVYVGQLTQTESEKERIS